MTETYAEKFNRLVKERTEPTDEVFRGTLSTQTVKDLDMKELYSEVIKWGEKSAQGLLCGIYGCNSEPSSPCTICKCGYCPEHITMHFHSAENDGVHRVET